MKLIVHATNVHTGGGLTVLHAALEGIGESQETVLLADRRLDPAGLPEHVHVERWPPTVVGRLAAERRLHTLAAPGDIVLCMGNLPPLLACRGTVLVYLQNRYLCGDLPLRDFPVPVRLRLAAERIWLRRRLTAEMRVLVQTPSMQRAAREAFGVDATVLPLGTAPSIEQAPVTGAGVPMFLYPATGHPHKNHTTLLAAWALLDQSGIKAELHVTVEPDSPVAVLVARAQAAGIPVVNHGPLRRDELLGMYRSARALIFPSRIESFGLPLIEARAAHLPIIAAELDYVRDVAEPAQTFDPASPLSLARAVRRFLGTPESPITLLTPDEFLTQILLMQR